MNPEPETDAPEKDDVPKPLVSIVVLAYKNPDYTRQCIESIYRYTSHINFELITINNGSPDGTGEYFNSLPNTKKISYPENIGVCTAFNEGFRLAEGKYTMNVSNDIVVTPHWLDNLLTCMETDPSIGMVVPVCDASCNYQQVNLPYSTMDELMQAAERYNVSNPALWEERLKLLAYAVIYRTELLRKIGGFDEDFNPGCYDDDAMSFNVRRMGYKVILAKDTFVHHYGARVFNEQYDRDNTLMRRNYMLFFQKFRVDPYVAGLIDDKVLNLLTFSGKETANILGIGRSYGTTVLQLKNLCKYFGSKNIRLSYLSEHVGNLTDLKTICEDCRCAPPEEAASVYGGKKYDYIIVESDSAGLSNPEHFFESLYGLLSEGGQLVCTAATPGLLYRIMGTFYRLGANFEKQTNYYYLCFSKPEASGSPS